eukprot:2478400-Rhodomonas_salina.1
MVLSSCADAAICLRAYAGTDLAYAAISPYAMSGTDIAYGGHQIGSSYGGPPYANAHICYAMSHTRRRPVILRRCYYAMPGTDLGHTARVDNQIVIGQWASRLSAAPSGNPGLRVSGFGSRV